MSPAAGRSAAGFDASERVLSITPSAPFLSFLYRLILTSGSKPEGLTGVHRNSFDAVRLLAALAVFWFHQVAILGGPAITVPVFDYLSLGELGVLTFFAVSGFLVTRSLRKNLGPARYAWSRVLRIYPALAACLVFCLILGATVTSRPEDYFGWPPMQFVLGNLAIFAADTQLQLPGVFDQSIWHVVNTPIYTLRYEILFYAGLLVLWHLPILRRVPRLTIALLAIGAVVASMSAARNAGIEHFTKFDPLLASRWGFAFTLGASMAFVRRGDTLRAVLLLALGFALGAMAVFDFQPQVDYLVGVVVVSSATLLLGGSGWLERLVPTRRWGDLSYGIYLFGLPVQQLVLTEGTGLPDPALAGFAFSLTVTCAVVSRRIVELPALRLKARLDAGDGLPARRDLQARWAAKQELLLNKVRRPGGILLVLAAAVALIHLIVGSPQAPRLAIGAVASGMSVLALVWLLVFRRRTQGRWIFEPPTALVAVSVVWHLGFWLVYYLGLAEPFRVNQYLGFAPTATTATFFVVLVGILASTAGVMAGLGAEPLKRPARAAGPGTLPYVLAALGCVLVVGYAATAGRDTLGDYAAVFTQPDGVRRIYNFGVVLVIGLTGPVLLLEQQRRRIFAYLLLVATPTAIAASALGSRWVLYSLIVVGSAATSVRATRIRVVPVLLVLVLAVAGGSVVKQFRAGHVNTVADVTAVLTDPDVNPFVDLPQELGQAYITVAGTFAALDRRPTSPTHIDLQWGWTYAASLITVVPSAERLTGLRAPRPGSDFAKMYFPEESKSRGYAMGFSYIGELMLNFGIIGVLLGSFGLFYALSRLYRRAVQTERLALLYVVWSVSSFALFGMRNDWYTTFRWMVWAGIITYVVGRHLDSGRDAQLRWPRAVGLLRLQRERRATTG